MIIDHENTFDWRAAITVSRASTDIVDMGPGFSMVGSGDGGRGVPLPLFLGVDTTFTAAGAATLTVDVQSSPVENFGSGVITHSSKTIAKADLSAGNNLGAGFFIPEDTQRYVRLNYTVATGPFTAGKINAAVVASRQTSF